MSLKYRYSSKGGINRPDLCSFLIPAFVAATFAFAATGFSQQPILTPTQPGVKLTSRQFVAQDGLSVNRLIELGTSRRADLQAARQRLAIAQGRLTQASFRPNPTFDTEYGSPRFLGGEPEFDFSAGVTQVFELGGKRSRRIAVAELELAQAKADVAATERQLIVGIRAAYTTALSAARQLDVLERLTAGNEEIVRVTEARLNEGDVAPLDVNLVKVENDRLKVQAIRDRTELETALFEIRTLIGVDISESLRLAPQPERPPRFDLGLSELTAIAVEERPDLQAARIGEELGSARISLARANAVPNVAGAVRFSRNKGIVDLPGPLNGRSFASDLDNELRFGVSVDIPIFNRNQGEIASATAERLQATRNREFLESTVKRDVAVAYRKYRAAAEALVVYTTQIMPRAEANLQTVRAAYTLGDFSVFEVVSEQRRLSENVTNTNQSLRDYYDALTELETAIGTTLPASGFAPEGTSVLPDKELSPNSIDRASLLKALEGAKSARASSLLNTGSETNKKGKQ